MIKSKKFNEGAKTMLTEMLGGSALLLVGAGLAGATVWGAMTFGTPSWERRLGQRSDGETTMWFVGAVVFTAIGIDLILTGGQNTQQFLAALARRC